MVNSIISLLHRFYPQPPESSKLHLFLFTLNQDYSNEIIAFLVFLYLSSNAQFYDCFSYNISEYI